MNGNEPPEKFFSEKARAAYRRWQKAKERNDDLAQALHNRRTIENGDPECEQVITALEQGWLRDSDR